MPYLKNKTKFSIYHFFSVNYALRKNFLLRASLINNSKIVKQNFFWFPAFSVTEIDLSKFWRDLNGETMFIELFHPKIPLNHGGLDGALRCWGNYYDDEKKLKCTVHTLHVRKKSNYSKKDFWPRSIVSDYKKENTMHFSRSYKIFKKNDNIKTHMGFSMIVDEKSNPMAVWHDGSTITHSFFNEDDNTEKTLQGFWCPKSKNLDPLLFIDAKETRLKSNQATIYLLDENKVQDKSKINFKGSLKIKVSEVFKKRIEGPYIVLVEFKRSLSNNFGYLNVRFDKKDSSGDMVHTWEANWSLKEDKFLPVDTKGISSCRKFFYFQNNLDNKNIDYFLLIYMNKKSEFHSKQIKLRVLLDNKKEFLKTFEVDFKKPIMVINLNEIFDFTKFGNFENGIVQLESLYDNFRSTFYIYDNVSEVLATDHLTGG